MLGKILCFAGGTIFGLVMTCCFVAAEKEDVRIELSKVSIRITFLKIEWIFLFFCDTMYLKSNNIPDIKNGYVLRAGCVYAYEQF